MPSLTPLQTSLNGWLQQQVNAAMPPDVATGVQFAFNEQQIMLKLPERQDTLFVFMPLTTVDFGCDSDLLTLGMMLNIEPGLMCGAAIGLDAPNRTLVLTAHQAMLSFNERELVSWLTNTVHLGVRIRDEFALAIAGRKPFTGATSRALAKRMRFDPFYSL
ncbi:CesT family type III secretion system chaperone [Pectobacterium actinidiae]|uniref:CesT family type III secretion system chaperone n=1 Tax=Pectobacterium actinidiae TaxID=1507808 RepID=UPI0032ECF31D